MEDLTLEDLRRVRDWVLVDKEWTKDDEALLTRVKDKITQLEELNNLDLDDCAGGACKL